MAPQKRARKAAALRLRRQQAYHAMPDTYPCPVCGHEDSVTIKMSGAHNYARGRKLVTDRNETLGCQVNTSGAHYDLVATIKCGNCGQKDSVAKGPPFKLPLDFYSFWSDYYANLEDTNPGEWAHIQRTNKVLKGRLQKIKAIADKAKARQPQPMSEFAERVKGRSYVVDRMLEYGQERMRELSKARSVLGSKQRSMSRPRSVIRQELASVTTASVSKPVRPSLSRKLSTSRPASRTGSVSSLTSQGQVSGSETAMSSSTTASKAPSTVQSASASKRCPMTPGQRQFLAAFKERIARRKGLPSQSTPFKRKLAMASVDTPSPKKRKTSDDTSVIVSSDTFPPFAPLDMSFGSSVFSKKSRTSFRTKRPRVATFNDEPRRPITRTTITAVYDSDED